jgi:hypothetical protein
MGQGNASARGILVTARARATFSGGTSPAGSPDPDGGLAAAVKAFQRLYSAASSNAAESSPVAGA